MNIFAQIRREEKDFNKDVEIVDGFSFNQLDTVETVILYYNSRFRDGQFYTDEEYRNQRKFFHNINRAPCDNATKNLDIDTKDVYPTATKESDYIKAKILREDLYRYMKKHKIGQMKNVIAEEAPIFGTVVLKKVPGDEIVEIVDLRNLINDPTANKLADGFVIEKHYYTPEELRKMPWDNIDKAITTFTQFNETEGNSIPFIEIYERYGEVPLSWYKEARNVEVLPEDDNKFIKTRFIVAGVNKVKELDGIVNENGIILDVSEMKDIPYKEYRYTRIKGRWLGEGEVEKTFDPQIRINELTNYKIQGLRLSTLHLFVTPDSLLQSNILNDCDNGDILVAPNGIAPLMNEERNLSAYVEEERRVDDLVVGLTSSYDVVRGETMPSGTPFRSVAVQNINAAKLFDFKRENLGLFLKEVYREWIIPRLLKELNKEHILDMSDSSEEYKQFEEAIVKFRTWRAIQEMIKKGIKFDWGQIDMIKSAIREKISNKKLKIPVDYYKGFELDVDMNITGEKYNKSAVLESKFNLLEIIAKNPAILENPQTVKLFNQIAELSGTSPLEIGEGSPVNQQAQSRAAVRAMGSPAEITR